MRPTPGCRGTAGPAVIALLLAVVGPAAAPGPAPAARPDDPRLELVTRYLEALRTRNWATARSAWRADDLARAARLGIRYPDQPLKIDTDSPAGWLGAQGRLSAVLVADPEPHSLTGLLTAPPRLATVRVGAHAPDQPGGWSHAYLVAEEGGSWRLASPTGLVLGDCAGRAGAVAEGRYVRAITAPGLEGRVPALAALDSFVAVTLERLQVPAARRLLLEREKIDYLFAPPVLVEALARAPTVGVAILQVDAVVTHHPCHLHELAHVLVNFWLEELPLYTLPVLQEGMAVHLGGRWGRGPDALAPVGAMFLEAGWVTLPDLLPREAFHRLGADLGYAAAGVLAGWVLAEAGPQALAGAYRELSGNPADLDDVSADSVAAALGAALGLAEPTLDGLRRGLAAHLAGLPANPLRAAPPAAAAAEPVRRLEDGGLTLALWPRDGRWVAEITAPSGGVPAGALLVPGPASATSALFGEHFPGQGVPTAAGALRFSPDEAGWYDYRRDLLVAKHVASFWPEPPAYDPATRTLRLTWPQGLVPWDLQTGPLMLQADRGR